MDIENIDLCHYGRGELIDLCEQLRAQNARLQSIIDEANAQEPVGYMVRGSFFYSKVQAEKSADHLTANYENTDVINVYVDPIPAQQSPVIKTIEPQSNFKNDGDHNFCSLERKCAGANYSADACMLCGRTETNGGLCYRVTEPTSNETGKPVAEQQSPAVEVHDPDDSVQSIACTLHNYATHLHYAGNEKLADQLE